MARFSWFASAILSNIGAQKLTQIRENNNYFRSELQKMGFEVLGDNDSSVMPIMLYNPAKIPAFSRECLKRNVRFITLHNSSRTTFYLLCPYWYFDYLVFFYELCFFEIMICDWLLALWKQVAVVIVGFPATLYCYPEHVYAFLLLIHGKTWSEL